MNVKQMYLQFCLFILPGLVLAQEMDSDLMLIKDQLEQVTSYTAQVTFEVDISFINMPKKEATIFFQKGEKLRFDSDDFVLIPKKGLDLSLNQLFDQSFITVDRGMELWEGTNYKVINIIPTDDKADFSIAKLFLDTQNKRIRAFEVSTKNEGIYKVGFQFDANQKILPEKVRVSFELEKVSLPFNFMGKDTDINRKEMRQEGTKEGAIYLSIDYKNITLEER